VTRRALAIGVAALAVLGVLALLVAVGRWEERRAAREQIAGMRTVLTAIGGDIVSPSLSGYRYGPPDCLAYHDKVMLLALQLCFDPEGRVVQAVDRRPDQPRYYSLEYKPSLSTIRFPPEKVAELVKLAASRTGLPPPAGTTGK
jgi:hypothetical protein